MANVEISNFSKASEITKTIEDARKLILQAKDLNNSATNSIPKPIKEKMEISKFSDYFSQIDDRCNSASTLISNNINSYLNNENKTNSTNDIASVNTLSWALLSNLSTIDAETLMSQIPKEGINSMQIAVFSNGEITSTSNFNTSDNTLYPISSCSKAILGIIAAKMQEDGIINLDSNMEDYWHRAYYYDYSTCTDEWRSMLESGKTLKDYTNPNKYLVENSASLRDALTHSSTIKNMSMVYMEPNNHSSEYFGGGMSANYGRAAFMLAHTYGQLFNKGQTPGTKTDYNYLNDTLTREHSLAGMTMQVSMKESVNEYLENNILSPLGINDNSSFKDGNSIYFATSYNSSATDLAKIVSAVANNGVYDGKQIFSQETINELEKVYPNLNNQTIAFDYVNGKYIKYGNYSTISDPSQYGISNDINNYATYISFDPKTSQGMVININYNNNNYKNNSYNTFNNASNYFYSNNNKNLA